MSWNVYMILSTDNYIYTGITKDIKRRWQQHVTGKGGAKFFRGRRPAGLLYLENVYDHSMALRKEMALKKSTREQKLHYIKSHSKENKAFCLANDMPVIKLQ